MKKMKKLLSMLLAVIMVLAMAAPSFAEEIVGAEGDTTGKITIDNPMTGITYTAYKIFDVTYVRENGDTENGDYAYSLASSETALYNVVSSYVNKENSGLTLTLSSDGSKYIVAIDKDKFSAPKFAAHLAENASNLGAGKDLKADGSKVSVDELALGYYFVSGGENRLCNLTTTIPEVTIHDKNDNPFGKDDDADDVEIGQPVNYTLLGKVPDTTGYSKYDYIITDKMDAGLTFNKDVKVYYAEKITEEAFNDITDINKKAAVKPAGASSVTEYYRLGAQLENTYYTVNNEPTATDNFTFKLTIDVMKLKNMVTTPLIIKYSATVNENAVTKVSENNAKLEYSNNPANSDSKATLEDKEDVHSAKIVIDKYARVEGEPNNKDTKLKGAEFILARKVKDANGEPTDVMEYYKATIENNKVTKVEWVNEANKAQATRVTTNDQGAAEFKGLKDDTYYLRETKAPAGYNLLDHDVDVTINGESATVSDGGSLTVNAPVENVAGIKLPSTGGIGTTIFYAIGIILMAGAVFFVVRRKRA